MQVLLEALVIEGLEGLSVVEISIHGIGLDIVLMEDVQIQVLGPPILVGSHVRGGVGHSAAVHHWALRFITVVLHGAKGEALVYYY